MTSMRIAFLVLAGVITLGTGRAQQASAKPETSAPVAQSDASLDVAADYVGRALFLRCFCAENDLSFDGQGKPTGAVKPEDWTLAAVNVLKVERKKPGFVELNGVRVAIKYAPDRHEFERHAQNDEKMHITVADTGDPKQMERTLLAVFSVGIDLPLQRSMPDYWQHYFDQKMTWPHDDLSNRTIYSAHVGDPGPAMTQPSVTHRADATYTPFAMHDRVKGTVQLRLVVDAQGAASRVTITQPLGYGLDEKAVEAVQKFRFAPATKDGAPLDSVVLLNEDFVPVTVPR